MNPTRRSWLSGCLAIAAWPEVVAAQHHARAAMGSPATEYQTLDVETAREIEAIAAQIIPSTGGPGAREAGVIYFIDRALATFARDDREAYRTGMAALQRKRKELFPESTTIASLAGEQQIALIRAVETTGFFELLRTHTVLGFLGDPSYGGNRGQTGWQQIGFTHEMHHQSPFGYYDAEVNREVPGEAKE